METEAGVRGHFQRCSVQFLTTTAASIAEALPHQAALAKAVKAAHLQQGASRQTFAPSGQRSFSLSVMRALHHQRLFSSSSSPPPFLRRLHLHPTGFLLSCGLVVFFSIYHLLFLMGFCLSTVPLLIRSSCLALPV